MIRSTPDASAAELNRLAISEVVGDPAEIGLKPLGVIHSMADRFKPRRREKSA